MPLWTILLLAPPTDGEVAFARTVLPILQARCVACHGGDKVRGGLDLTTRTKLLAGGDNGSPVIPGKPAISPLLRMLARADGVQAMPPKENDKLTAAEVAAFRAWVAAGAPWPDADRLAELARVAADGVKVATSGGLSPEWTDRRYKPEDLWAYQPLKAVVPPPGRHPIDGLLDLPPGPAADARTLLRRVTFGLTGLPPGLDDEPGDWVRTVERLLASPHYGEQMARHWLDVARYADSSGFANDYERGNAWRYRDYVVRAFNADKPWADFVREQLAGDEIAPDDPEKLVAVGFLRGGPWELTGMEVAKVARQRFLDDVTDAVGQVFLATPLQCARCHDHKFDPVPTRDYYRVQAAFATTQLAERAAPFLPAENTAGFAERKYLDARQAHYRKLLAEVQAKEEAAARKWCADRGLDYVARPEGLRKGIAEEKLPPARVGLEPRDLGLERIARKGLERLRWEFDRYEPFALSVYSGRTPAMKSVLQPLRVPANRLAAGELEATSILAGGDVFSPKEKVKPGALSVLHRDDLPDTVEGRRAALAEWIASRDNALAARVIVNRVWQWHFGTPLAGNPNNFGATGKNPTHPDLLDWLAGEFLRRGGSFKALHRLILTSEAYRRANRPRRLAAEELRDAMLATSGELNRAVGGVPARPEINAEVAFQPRMVMGTFAPAWEPSPLPQQRHRRSLYVLKLRGLRDPFFEVFNQPGPDTSCELRESSTVTPQAFTLLNGPATRGRALALAASVLKETSDPDAALERVYRRVFWRSPTADERKACKAHWEAMTTRHRGLTFAKTPPPREITREAVEENTGEKFTYTEPLPSSADFVPDLHPADVSPEVRGLMEVCVVLFNTNEFAYLD